MIRGGRGGSSVGAAIVLALAPLTGVGGQNLPDDDLCMTCHLGLEEDRLREPAELFPEDVHGLRGFDCLSCHGRSAEGPGGLEPGAGFLSRPAPREVPVLCGRCHSDAAYMRDYDPGLRVDQVAEYVTSDHGRALVATGDAEVATCVSCHPAHRILAPDDPRSSVYPANVAELCAGCHADAEVMEPRGLDTDQLEEYTSSVHGRLMFEEEDLSAPTCNDCHGNHGAAPPGIMSVRNVCAQCHATMGDFFAGSGHVDLFEEADLPGCATCHGHHAIEATSDDLLDERSESVCARCHDETDPSGDAFRVMKSLIDSLESERARSRRVLEEAENLGMEVGQALFELEEVGNALVKARTAIHAFRVDPVREEVQVGLETAASTMERGDEALFEHWFRRAGLALSAAVILGLIIALTLKIRQIEVRVEQILGSIEAFFEEAMLSTRSEGGEVSQEAIRLAACALLVELAYADSEFSEAERRHLEELIQRRFGLGPEAAGRLIELSRAQHDRGTDLNEFTRLVARHFSEAEKQDLLDAMWGLVLSDGELAEHERRLMTELTRQLGMDPEWRTGARTGAARRWMRTFFGAMGRRWGGADEAPEDLHMAACALLVELVYADEDFSELERSHLENLLGRHFGMTPGESDRLIRLTEEQREEGLDIRDMASIIGTHYSREEKLALVDAMWGLVAADGVLATKERELMEQIMELLDIEPDWVAAEDDGQGSGDGA